MPQKPLVVTYSLLSLAGCAREPTYTHNPPPPTATPHLGDAGTVAIAAEPHAGPLNAGDHEGRRVFVSETGGCYVELPWPTPGTRLPGEPLPRKGIPCPQAMRDSAWNKCTTGTITLDENGKCTCRVFGNPPPLPFEVACPR